MIRLRYGVPWVLAACAAAQAGGGLRELVLKLQRVSVAGLAPHLDELLGAAARHVTCRVDPAANTLTFVGKANDLRDVLDVVEALDAPRPADPDAARPLGMDRTRGS